MTSLLGLLPPLIYRALIDQVLPSGNLRLLNLLAIGLFAVPLLTGLLGVVQRHFSARAGEGIIYDLRNQMFDHLGRMSMRFFTNTKSGEIVSRFNNDAVSYTHLDVYKRQGQERDQSVPPCDQPDERRESVIGAG